MSNDKQRMTLDDVKEMTRRAGQYDELVKQNKRYEETLQEIANPKEALHISELTEVARQALQNNREG